MEIIGIIAEYNPFHNGHLYQIKKTRQMTQCDAVVAVMSGHFSQRGEATITNKFTRTKMALENGIDLVIELPALVATASAERFAQGAVSLLNQAQIITQLSFGSECGNIQLLNDIAHVLITETSTIDHFIKFYLKQGLSYPQSRQKALVECLSQYAHTHYSSLIETLQSPNNILGIEYIKALRLSHSAILPFTIHRQGGGYHDTTLTHSLASASAIRKALYHSDSNYQNSLPPSSMRYLKHITLPSMENLSSFLHYKLMFSCASDLYATWDVPEDLIRTLCKASLNRPSYRELVQQGTSKTYSKSTVQRSLLRLLLEGKTSMISTFSPILEVPYIRVLGCKKTHTWLLKLLVEQATIPVITNLSRQYDTLSAYQKSWLDYECKATRLYAYATHLPELAQSDFTHPFITL